MDLDPWVLGVKLGQRLGNIDEAHPLCLQRPEHDGPAHRALDRIDGVARRARRLERRARLREQRAAGIAQRDFVSRAVEQARPELALEVANPCRDGGLHDVEPIRSAREAALLGHRYEHRQLPELHPRSLSPDAITVSKLLR